MARDDFTPVTTQVELSGNFFTHDPGRTLYGNLGLMLDGLADEMEGIVQREIAAHEGEMEHYTGWSHDHAIGFRSWDKHWATYAAVGANTQHMDAKHAKRTKAAASTIEKRWHPFRKVKSAAYRAKAILSADLTKGLD